MSSERPPELEVRGPRHRDEVVFANDLMAKTLGHGYFEALARVQAHAGYPNHQVEHTRLAFWNGELAGTLRITSDTIRLGEARLHMAGLGWVSTAAEHRHKGVARELIHDALNYVRARNYHVAMLFGIPNFYHRFGFTTTLCEYQTDIGTVDAKAAPAGDFRVRLAKPGDIPAIQRMHNTCEAATACSIVRIGAHLSNRWDLWRETRVLCDARGKVLAYFVPTREKDLLTISETGFADRALCGPLLGACAQLATEEFAQRIRFLAPPEHQLIQYLLQFRSRHETQVFRDEGGMMGFVNLGETLESMLPEWESQVQRAGLGALRAEVSLVVDRVSYRVRANRGAVDVAPAPGPNKLGLSSADLMHLMTGYRYLDEVLAQRRRIISPEGRALLAALFPKRTPYVWPLDRF